MTPERQAPLSRITAPTLVIHGTDDPLLPLPNGQALAALIPAARFEAVPGMGHSFFSPGIPAKIAKLDPGPYNRPAMTALARRRTVGV
jgi:pimeloyl-ACP methyl ester carboxylesterase